jgi:hypothetical protein
MGVHGDYEHLVHNLVSLLVSGYRPWATLGAAGFYAAFFGGGAAAALNSASKNLQLRRQWLPLFSAPARALREIGPWLPVPAAWHTRLEGVSEQWARATSGKIARMLQPHLRVCGCSAGITSLQGVTLCMTLEEFVNLARLGSTDQIAWCVPHARRAELSFYSAC